MARNRGRCDEKVALSLMFALERGIEATYELEDSELNSELLPPPGDVRDRMLFTEAAEGGAGVLRQLHDRLTRGQKVSLQPPRKVPAVLDRPGPVDSELRRPAQQPKVILRGGADRALSDLGAMLVDRNDGVGALVRVDPESDHEPCLLHRRGARTGGHIAVGGDATLLSSHASRSLNVRRVALRTVANGNQRWSERAGRPRR